MKTTRERPRKRRFRWVVFAILFLLVLWDSYRRPEDQATASTYVATVRIYQWLGRPFVKQFCTCRYLPTCSEYSVEAVQTHGIRYGLYLTVKRLFSCNDSVPRGTWDPVPGPDEVK
jgi:putative membrane protein insertion efficiency factor